MSKTIMLQKKVKGKIIQVPCEIDYLSSADESEACSFYNAEAELVGNPEIFFPDNNLPSDLAGDGIVLGVKAESQIICIRVLTFNRDIISEYKNALRDNFIERTACSDCCIVDSRFRGNNLQLLTWFWMEPLLYDLCNCVVATVSPKNLISLKNLLSCGFMIVANADMYGDYERLILRKKLTGIQRFRTTGRFEISVHDREGMTDLFSKGYVGYKLKHKPAGMCILMGKETV